MVAVSFQSVDELANIYIALTHTRTRAHTPDVRVDRDRLPSTLTGGGEACSESWLV